MRVMGHKYEIVDSIPLPETGNTNSQTAKAVTPEMISRETFLDDVGKLLKRKRGRELPGMFNTLLIDDLFREQSMPWERLASSHLEAVLKASQNFLELIISYLTNDTTAEAICQEVINPLVEERSKAMKAKLAELLWHHKHGHPITCNHYFTETVQKFSEKRFETELLTDSNVCMGTWTSQVKKNSH
jgi:hypothetical protein